LLGTLPFWSSRAAFVWGIIGFLHKELLLCFVDLGALAGYVL